MEFKNYFKLKTTANHKYVVKWGDLQLQKSRKNDAVKKGQEQIITLHIKLIVIYRIGDTDVVRQPILADKRPLLF